MLAGELKEMLRCFRCGACINHCPVYGSVGGHAYGWVYPGPMGSVVTPVMVGIDKSPDLPHACTLNGRCAEVCPMSIPLPSLLRKHRQATFEQQLQTRSSRLGLLVWSALARRPAFYRLFTRGSVLGMSLIKGRRGSFKRLPLAGGWTKSRDLPVPQGKSTFMALYRSGQHGSNGSGSTTGHNKS
jgi:L-lactate dehydrogenase complex protein LldF